MSTGPATTPGARTVRVMNARRMILVWALLLASMTVVALAGWAALPGFLGETSRKASEDRARGRDAALADVIWPQGMAAERSWKYIVIHHSATSGATLEAIARDHTDRLHADGTAYHFLINNGRSPGTGDGQIVPTPRWLRQAPGAHANVPGHPEFSHTGIGICMVGNFNQESPTPRQMDSLVALVALLGERHGIPLDRIVGHGEVQTTDCPGRRFPMALVLGRLRQVSLRKQLAASSPEGP